MTNEDGDDEDDWLGLASWCVDNGHVVKSKARLNTVNLEVFSHLENIHQHVLCHEFGHALGLPHSESDNSCMNACNWQGTYEERSDCFNNPAALTPDEGDQAQLLMRYNVHDDDLNRGISAGVDFDCSGEL